MLSFKNGPIITEVLNTEKKVLIAFIEFSTGFSFRLFYNKLSPMKMVYNGVARTGFDMVDYLNTVNRW